MADFVNLVVADNHVGMAPLSLGEKKFLPFQVKDSAGKVWTLIRVSASEEINACRPPSGTPCGYIRAPDELQAAEPLGPYHLTSLQGTGLG